MWFTGTWSADGEWVVAPKGFPVPNLYRVRTRAGSPEERLTTSSHRQLPTSISPDGTMLVYEEANPTTNNDIWVMRLPPPGTGRSAPTGGTAPRQHESRRNERTDFRGRPVARLPIERVGPFRGVHPLVPGRQSDHPGVDRGRARSGLVAKDTDLFYRSNNGSVMLATVTSAPEPAVSTPRRLFDAPGYENGFEVSPDDQRFLMMPLIATEAAGGQSM